MDIDEAFDVVGHFGRHQKWLMVSSQSVGIYLSFQMLMLVFMVEPEPDLNQLHCTNPPRPSTAETVCSTHCDTYRYPLDYPSNIVSEWDLVCDRAYLSALSHSCMMAGVLIGSIVCGILSDMFGRRLTIICTLFTLLSFTFFTVLVTNYTLFLVSRLFIGFVSAGLALSSAVFVTEIVGPSYRSLAIFFGTFSFTTGLLLMAVIGSLLQPWRSFMLTLNLIGLPLVFLYWVLPESPRWLYSHGYVDEAEQVLFRFAVKNGRKLARKDVKLKRTTADDGGRLPMTANDLIGGGGKGVKRFSPLDLLRIRSLRWRTVVMGPIWLITSLVYYGISMSVTSLGGSMYVNFALLAVAELPSLFAIYFIERYGRRLVLMICYATAGAACVFVPYIPDDGMNQNIQTGFALVGKLSIATAFSTIYVYVSELYPTVIRNNALGFCSMCARIGGILAPFVILLGRWWKTAPYLIFGLTGILAAVLTSFLPETLNQPLPETVSGMTTTETDTELKLIDYDDGPSDLEMDESDLES